jgi:hypothetical protein
MAIGGFSGRMQEEEDSVEGLQVLKLTIARWISSERRREIELQKIFGIEW